ncbi:MAG: Coenzyme F420 hydrogenase/dehydrogenase, beta subunit C-terminal domain [Eubacterium sp.]|nr:Coenzyme F420 hydrogenase/dehydrogenase, beta subunit C-terminal domain [Eubacterium sp.]
MIEIRNKQDCCGCTACASACPKACITMTADSEGFQYPVIDKEKCIDCHNCEKKCPVLGQEKVVASPDLDKAEVIRRALAAAESLPEASVCFLKDEKLRRQSTSGGMFTALAHYALELGGIVCGVILDDEQMVVHSFAENEAELAKMRRSKYVQSNQDGVYQSINEILKQGRLVLYTGTPCQVAGLKSYLGCEYENLITVDVFCHGVGSPLYWEKYLQYISQKMKSPIKEVCFREKTYGYNSACQAVYFQNGKSIHRGHDDDLYWTAFSKNYIYRPSCYACAFKSVNHVSDFTVGDFWNAGGLSEQFRAANGCSLVLCHSEKAIQILEAIRPSLETTPVELEEALNINGGHQASMLITSPALPEKREDWFADMSHLSPQELVDKYLPIGLKEKVKSIVKPVLYRIGLLEKIKSKN